MKASLKVLTLVGALATAPAFAGGSFDAAVGGGLGGALGAAVGHEMGGRDGAVLGGVLGGGLGAAITTSHNDRDRYDRRSHRYRDRDDGYRGGYSRHRSHRPDWRHQGHGHGGHHYAPRRYGHGGHHYAPRRHAHGGHW